MHFVYFRKNERKYRAIEGFFFLEKQVSYFDQKT